MRAKHSEPRDFALSLHVITRAIDAECHVFGHLVGALEGQRTFYVSVQFAYVTSQQRNTPLQPALPLEIKEHSAGNGSHH